MEIKPGTKYIVSTHHVDDEEAANYIGKVVTVVSIDSETSNVWPSTYWNVIAGDGTELWVRESCLDPLPALEREEVISG